MIRKGIRTAHSAKLRRRVKAGVLPPPTFVNEYGLKFFDEDWIKEARAILANSFEGQTQPGRFGEGRRKKGPKVKRRG